MNATCSLDEKQTQLADSIMGLLKCNTREEICEYFLKMGAFTSEQIAALDASDEAIRKAEKNSIGKLEGGQRGGGGCSWWASAKTFIAVFLGLIGLNTACMFMFPNWYRMTLAAAYLKIVGIDFLGAAATVTQSEPLWNELGNIFLKLFAAVGIDTFTQRTLTALSSNFSKPGDVPDPTRSTSSSIWNIIKSICWYFSENIDKVNDVFISSGITRDIEKFNNAWSTYINNPPRDAGEKKTAIDNLNYLERVYQDNINAHRQYFPADFNPYILVTQMNERKDVELSEMIQAVRNKAQRDLMSEGLRQRKGENVVTTGDVSNSMNPMKGPMDRFVGNKTKIPGGSRSRMYKKSKRGGRKSRMRTKKRRMSRRKYRR